MSAAIESLQRVGLCITVGPVARSPAAMARCVWLYRAEPARSGNDRGEDDAVHKWRGSCKFKFEDYFLIPAWISLVNSVP
jgi:hypothetical protein